MKDAIENRKLVGALLSRNGLAALVSLLCSCSIASQPTWHPADPLVKLDDIHGLFGGNELLVDQSGQVWNRHVDDRCRERRYYTMLSSEELGDLHRTLRESGILQYREAPYNPGPCVVRMKITITRPGKPPFVAEMWDHFDKASEEPVFTAFHKYLTALCKQAEQQKPYYSGPSNSRQPLP